VWHRYDHDGYGEHADGAPFDGTGVGRGWPLLAGERAHYELAAGRADEAERLGEIMRAQTSPGGLIPEQVWDAGDIPERELANGHPSGSAMPLVWAHAEYIKLARSLNDGRVFDTPPQTVSRYLKSEHRPAHAIWRFDDRISALPTGKILRIETRAAATIRWSASAWRTFRDVAPTDTRLGIWYADLPTAQLPIGAEVAFTFHWLTAGRWEGTNFKVLIAPP
jgi:glucoamylase